ncbi:hypothetical protein V6N11_053694 [Hibiscus sabdariffa]|uniref:UGP3-like C-terminal hexapeptide repeats domain-containing protein n=1 Tax=Hibiscus sabdariffa TaxID=183260 RepID=A0ABR2S1P0_9ROSI
MCSTLVMVSKKENGIQCHFKFRQQFMNQWNATFWKFIHLLDVTFLRTLNMHPKQLYGGEGFAILGGEMYPLGGSADRLSLVDSETGECLPAAMLPYCGRILLEGLIRDLQLYGKQCITPVAIMTISAKNNHKHITSLCERLGWFGRGRESFQLIEQPLVSDVSAEDGHWLVRKPFVPVCKPGGHGVIWKLAYDKGILEWFYDHGRKGVTVQQVRDHSLHLGKKLEFASYKRNIGATEGINVLIEKKNLDSEWAYGVSCIEYTEFDKFGITSGHPSPNWVTSSAKKKRKPADTSLHQILDSSLLDIMRSAYDLLSQCDADIPEVESNKYVDSGLPFLIFLQPALRSIWEVTRQKFSGGSISKCSELQVEVAEFLGGTIQIEGSMIIAAKNIMGSTRVDDKGAEDASYIMHLRSYYYVVSRLKALKGNHVFEVPNGYKLKITSGDPCFYTSSYCNMIF